MNNTLGVWGWINRNVQEIHTTAKENKTNYRGQKVVKKEKITHIPQGPSVSSIYRTLTPKPE